MRLGLFGGTFDPPHAGHLAVARAAVQEFGLQLLLAPTGYQPLKSVAPEASFEDRLAMVRLLCAGEDGLQASEVDRPRNDGQPNYTIDSLRSLQTEHAGAELFAVVGADAFLDLRRWRDPEGLLRTAEWVVVSRPGFDLGTAADMLELTREQQARVHLLETVHMDVSATEVRRRLHDGLACDGLLTPAVAGYIAEHGLYRSSVAGPGGARSAALG